MNYHVKTLLEIDSALCTKLRQYTFDVIGCCQIVHRELGPYLNEYMYQEALEIVLNERQIPHLKEYYFSIDFHGQRIKHKHYVDFFVKDNVYVECKATERLCSEQRQQLWNYMRLTKVRIGILYNFAPVKDQCERYYLDTTDNQMYAFWCVSEENNKNTRVTFAVAKATHDVSLPSPLGKQASHGQWKAVIRAVTCTRKSPEQKHRFAQKQTFRKVDATRIRCII